MRKKPLILCILDGWGVRNSPKNNAILHAKTPFMDFLLKNYPNSLIKASGEAVGLPEGQIGNSEVGHMSISSGRIILQDLPRINQAFNDKSIFDNFNLINFINNHNDSQRCHILGLFSNGGVHSSLSHYVDLAKYLATKQNMKIYLHLFADGRDTAPFDIMNNLKILENLSNHININIATLSGRYYSMDRDNRWERIEKAYNAIILGEGPKFNNITEAIEYNYSNNCFDEFILPSVIGDYSGFNDGDSIIMTNFRADRAIQILSALVLDKFDNFHRQKVCKTSQTLSMTEYSKKLLPFVRPIFSQIELKNIFPEVISNNNLTQLRIAETEKYAHVTYFFNGGKDFKFRNEERILIDSKKISTYDLFPEMSAKEITDALISAIDSEEFDIIIVNYANCDMVGHTGNLGKAVIAIETIDKCLSKVKIKLDEKMGHMIITSDHGNAEEMFNIELNLPHTSHTTNPVPFIIIGSDINNKNFKLRRDGRLCDIAPTILDLINIVKPHEMTGVSLILRDNIGHARF